MVVLRNKFEGVVVAVLTPFTQEGKVDEGALSKHLTYLVKNRVNGLFILGTTGLGPALALDEKKKVVDLAVDVVGGEAPVIVHVTDIVLPNVLELAKYASRKGVSAISITAPYFYNRVDEEALYQFLKAIVEVSAVPVLLYNQPAYTGINISVEIVRKLRAESEVVAGIKDSSGNLTQIYNYIKVLKSDFGEDFTVLTGGDSLFYPALMLGADGIVSALANIVPELFIKLYESFRSGDKSEALSIQKRIDELRSILKSYSQLSAYYEAGRQLGLSVGYPRLPIRRLSSSEVADLRERLSRAGFLPEK